MLSTTRSCDLEVARLDIALQLVNSRTDFASLPSRDARVEDVVHLLESLALGLRSSEEHVDERQGIECAENHVHLPVDAPQQRWDSERKNAVPGPVAGGCEGDGLRADLGGEDLGWICPGRRAPGGGEGGDEQIGAGDDALGDGAVLLGDDPRDVLVC